jgi:hypothetical protein
MTTLIQRIDDTRSHLSRQSVALVSQTRRAGDGFVRAVQGEVREWNELLAKKRLALRVEVERLSAPRGIERAALRIADEALARAHRTVHGRLGELERELRPVAKKAARKRPASKRASSRAPSRKLVTAPEA